MPRKTAAGAGTIRKKTVIRHGKEYTYWEARYTAGYDPGTGKQIQKSITGKTQKEVSQKLKAATLAIDTGTYIAPSKMTVGKWLDIWAAEYLGGVKPSTVCAYTATINTHLKPGLGAIRLDELDTHTIQEFYNRLGKTTEDKKALSPKTIKNVHGVLHKAMQQAVLNGYLRSNPTDPCILPRAQRKEITPLDESGIGDFLEAIRGHRFEELYTLVLFTGLREGEALGLTWDCVDLNNGTLTIDKQLQLVRGSKGEYRLVPTKNGKGRTITLAPSLLGVLKQVKRKQLQNRLRLGPLWTDSGFVFTDEAGEHLKHITVYKAFKAVMQELGKPEVRFHDLRHSYAVAALRSGDDVKTVQENLGHATAAFTLDVYGHVTEKMKQESAARMEQFIKAVNR